MLAAIRDDYRQGREEHSVFGTPTFVFDNGAAAYLQVFPPAAAGGRCASLGGLRADRPRPPLSSRDQAAQEGGVGRHVVTAPDLPRERVNRIQVRLLDWYAENARDLPWRRTRDPYAILVSEVMLQQTQVDRVLPYYREFMARFPTLREPGRGAYGRSHPHLVGAGVQPARREPAAGGHDDRGRVRWSLPEDLDDIRRLPGVGAYTAGAVAAFAFERDVAFLDTNMRRVVGRLAFGTDLPAANVESALQSAARALLPEGKSWSWNQALIEFGALHCTARRPNCVLCPLQTRLRGVSTHARLACAEAPIVAPAAR